MIHQNAPHCKRQEMHFGRFYRKNRPYGIAPVTISVRTVHYLTLFISSGVYTVPEITSVLTPGLIPQAPVVVSCVYVAAGTVILPATLANMPVISS